MSVSLSAFMFHVVLVAFEGPDRYSFVGGLATRMIDLSGALLDRGHRVHHLFVGDPDLPTTEVRHDGRHVLERWGQWISRYHPKDVYDGEDGKFLDFSRTVPPHLANVVIAAAAARGERACSVRGLADRGGERSGRDAALAARRPSAALFWNANNTYGFGQVDFPCCAAQRRSRRSRAICGWTLEGRGRVRRPAKRHRRRYLKPLAPSDVTALRKSYGDRPTFVKVARFDVDKRWLWAIDATATMRDAGMRPRFIMRGSRSPYSDVVGARIRARGLSVDRLVLPATATSRDLAAAIATTTGEVVFLDFFIDEKALRALYASADGVLANSEKEPFGLVGLEVMAAGGIAYLGRTGEDYAVPFGNAVVVQSDDPRELLTSYLMLRDRPELARSIRTDGRATAKRCAWPRILEGYESVWEDGVRDDS